MRLSETLRDCLISSLRELDGWDWLSWEAVVAVEVWFWKAARDSFPCGSHFAFGSQSHVLDGGGFLDRG